MEWRRGALVVFSPAACCTYTYTKLAWQAAAPLVGRLDMQSNSWGILPNRQLKKTSMGLDSQ